MGIEVAWWVGADDRWYRPALEITVRHGLVGTAPVLRTAVRVPGGDAVATVAAMRQGQRDVAVLDIANESPSPFAVAYVVRGPDAIDVDVDGAVVRIGGVPLLTLARPAAMFASVPPGDGADALFELVRSGGASAAPPAGRVGSLAVIVPVSHRTRVRAAVSIGADTAAAAMAAPVVGALKDPATVANGWAVHVGRAPVLDLPDPTIGERIRGLAASLLLAADAIDVSVPDDVAVRLPVVMMIARALSRVGMAAESARLTAAVGQLQRGRGDIGDRDSIDDTAIAVAALCEQVLLGRGDAVGAAPIVAGALEYVQRRSRKTPVGEWGAVFALGSWLLRTADEERAADAAHRTWSKLGAAWPVPRLALPPAPPMSAGADLLPSDPGRLADETLRLMDGVVAVGPDGSLSLLSAFTAAWEGQSIDVRQVPTPSGALSLSIRWHGARPALLWESERPVELTSPTLDASFRGSGASGDALLRR